MMMKGPFRELITLGEQRVVVKLMPAGARAKKVQLLRASREMPVEQQRTRLYVTV